MIHVQETHTCTFNGDIYIHTHTHIYVYICNAGLSVLNGIRCSYYDT